MPIKTEHSAVSARRLTSPFYDFERRMAMQPVRSEIAKVQGYRDGLQQEQPVAGASALAAAGIEFEILELTAEADGSLSLAVKVPTSMSDTTCTVTWPDGSTSDEEKVTADAAIVGFKSPIEQPRGQVVVAVELNGAKFIRKLDFTAGPPAAVSETVVLDEDGIAVASGRCAADVQRVKVTWPHCLGVTEVTPGPDATWRARAPGWTTEGPVSIQAFDASGRSSVAATVMYGNGMAPDAPCDVRIQDRSGTCHLTGHAPAGVVQVKTPNCVEEQELDAAGEFNIGLGIQPATVFKVWTVNLSGYRSATVEVPYRPIRASDPPKIRDGDRDAPSEDITKPASVAPGDYFWVVTDHAGEKVTVTFADGTVRVQETTTAGEGTGVQAARFQAPANAIGLATIRVGDVVSPCNCESILVMPSHQAQLQRQGQNT